MKEVKVLALYSMANATVDQHIEIMEEFWRELNKLMFTLPQWRYLVLVRHLEL